MRGHSVLIRSRRTFDHKSSLFEGRDILMCIFYHNIYLLQRYSLDNIDPQHMYK